METLEYHEGQAEELKETIDRNEEEQEEHEELLKITNEKLAKLEEQREAQVIFWKKTYTPVGFFPPLSSFRTTQGVD